MSATTTNIDIVRDRYRYVGAGWQSWATDKLSLIVHCRAHDPPTGPAMTCYFRVEG